jgi:hypothetical protein
MLPHTYSRFSVPTTKKCSKSFSNGRSKWATDSRSDPLVAPNIGQLWPRLKLSAPVPQRERESPPLLRSRPSLAIPGLLPDRAHYEPDLWWCGRERRKGMMAASSMASAGRAQQGGEEGAMVTSAALRPRPRPHRAARSGLFNGAMGHPQRRGGRRQRHR